MEKIIQPWSQKQIDNLNTWQSRTDIHPFTCGNGHTLIATKDGWICAYCPEYKQDWAWDMMATPKFGIAKFGEPHNKDIAK